MTHAQLKVIFNELIDKFGKGGRINTFEYCSNNGIRLADSTIDAVEIIGDGNVRFIYNENENDYDTLSSFDVYDLEDFYEAIEKAILLDKSTYKYSEEVKELSYGEYWDALKDTISYGDKVISVEGEDAWSGDEVIEFRNSCGCLLNMFNINRNIVVYY